MKKMLKIFALLIIALVVIIGAALAYVLNSTSFQTGIANDVLAKQFKGAKIEKLDAGLGKTVVTGIVFPLPTGEVFTADSVEVEYALTDLLDDKIHIKNVDLKNGRLALIDYLSKKSEEPAAAAAESSAKTEETKPAEQTAQTPATSEKSEFKWDIILDKLTANLAVTSPDGSSVDVKVQATQVEVKKLLPKSGAFAAEVVAKAKGFKPENFNLDATLLPYGDKMSLKLALRHNSQDLLLASGKFSQDYMNADAEAKLDIDDTQIKPLAAGFGFGDIPSFKTSLYAKGSVLDAAEKAEAQLVFKSSASNLKAVNPMLEPIGECGASGEVLLSKNGNVLSFSKIDINVSESGKNIVSANAPNSFSIDLKDLSKLPEGELAAATISIPARLISAFLPKEISYKADDLRTKIAVARGADNSIMVRTTSPLTLSNATVSKDGNVLIKDLTALLDASANAAFNGDLSANAKLSIAESADSALVATAAAVKKGNDISADITADGSLNPLISRVEMISGYAIPKELKLALKTSAAFDGKVATLKSLTANLFGEKNAQLLAVKDGGAISFNTETKEISVPSKKLLSAEMKDVPFALFKPFLAGVDVNAETISLSAEVDMPQADVFEVGANASLSRISFKKDGETLVRSITPNATAKVVFDKAKMTMTANIEKAEVSDGSSVFATASAAMDCDMNKKTGKATFKAYLQIPAILSQPALAKFANMSSGSIEADGEITMESAKISAQMHNVAAKNTEGSIGNIAASLAAKYNKDFSEISADADAVIKSTRGETSAKLNLKNAKDTRVTLNAGTLVVDDLMLLANAFMNPNYEAAKAANESADTGRKKIVRPALAQEAPKSAAEKYAVKDEKAFWNVGRAIYVDATIGKVVKGGKTLVENAEASMLCEETKLAISKLAADIMGAKLTAAADMKFDKNAQKPYTLENTKASLENFDVAQVFEDPANAMVSGVFNASGELKGSGNNMEHMLAYMTGNANITGKNGTLRLIDGKSTIGTVGTALQIAGAFLGNRANEVGAIGDIIDMLKTLNYSTAAIAIERSAPSYDYVVKTAEFDADDLIFSASGGKIAFNPDVPFKMQEINIPFYMLVRDGSGAQVMMRKIGTATDASDVKGFNKGPKFSITGTIAAPKSSLAEILGGSKSGSSSDSEKKPSLMNLFK